MGRKKNSSLTLIGLDIQGPWNKPLLENAASLSRASLVYAGSRTDDHPSAAPDPAFEEVAKRFDTVLACETQVKARDIYEFPAPRNEIALVVGNEDTGIPRSVLRQCAATVTIPMARGQLSSVNVAASAAIALYVLSTDLGRRPVPPAGRGPASVDLLFQAPADSAECGSLLRSAGAFGWKHVYLEDPAESWRTTDRDRVALSRAAARREINPIGIRDAREIRGERFSKVIWCRRDRTTTPLSRFRLDLPGRGIFVYGFESLPESLASLPRDDVYVDFSNNEIVPQPRHEGSVFLSAMAYWLRARSG